MVRIGCSLLHRPGAGKTALLTRWVKQLPEHLESKIIFGLIRADLGTADPRQFYPALSSRIAAFMDDPEASKEWPVDRDDPESHRDRIDGLLRHHRRPDHPPMTIVVDGLDELPIDEKRRLNSLFPKRAKPGLRYVVAARLEVGSNSAEAWEQMLGWQKRCVHLEPGPLDETDIADLLVRLGAPETDLASDPAVIDQLYKLTAGDPLLVNLYVKALWHEMPEDNKLKPEDLAKLRPGLAGYFDDWMHRQRRLWRAEIPPLDPTSNRPSMLALALLGQANGPLIADDLAALLELAGEQKPASVRALLRPFSAFLRGDGEMFGYTFNHPRLADFFGGGQRLSEERWEDLENHIIEEAAESFLKWGRSFLKAPPSTPGEADGEARPCIYILNHYLTHLIEANAPVEDLMELTRDRWRRAWLAYDGGELGFLDQVLRVWRYIRNESTQDKHSAAPPAMLSQQIRCALIASSIRNLGAKVPSELIARMLEAQAITPQRALRLIKRSRTAWPRVRLLKGARNTWRLPF